MEPKPLRTGLFASPGSIVLGLAGIVFVSYIFNFEGIETTLDSYFRQLDVQARSHTPEVTRSFLFALPFCAILLVGGIAYILLNALGHAITAPFKEAKKKRAKEHAKQMKLAAEPAGPKPPREEMVLIRPVRLAQKDVGVPRVTSSQG